MAGNTSLWACVLLMHLLYTVASVPIGPSTSSPSLRSTRTRLAERQLDSSIFSRLLVDPVPTPTYIDPSPDVPLIPNILVPLTVRPAQEDRDRPVIYRSTGTTLSTTSIPLPSPPASQSSKGPKPTGSHNNKGGKSNYLNHPVVGPTVPLGDTSEEIIASCRVDMASSLPRSFIPEVGVIRLFRLSSFKVEGAILRGCGCIPLQSPLVIESFVGSRNHSFAFYTNAMCEGQPYYQRFKEHYDVEPSMLTASVRIVQGVLPPISNKTEVF